MSRARVRRIDPLHDSWSGARMRAGTGARMAVTPDPNEQGVTIATGAAEQCLQAKKKPEPEVQP